MAGEELFNGKVFPGLLLSLAVCIQEQVACSDMPAVFRPAEVHLYVRAQGYDSIRHYQTGIGV